MSYAFDTLAKAWTVLQGHLPDTVKDGPLAHRFGAMLEELHEADHRLRGAINRDDGVTSYARRLDNLMNEREEEEPAEPADDGKRYKIVRHRFQGEKRTIKTGLTLAEAQAWCERDDTHGEGWFDGYTEE